MSRAAEPVPADRAADLVRLLEITRRLRENFEQGEWRDAADSELERRAILERVFDTRPEAAELPALTAALREVVRLNDELIGLAEHRRRAIGRELDTVAVGGRAGRAYLDAMASGPRL